MKAYDLVNKLMDILFEYRDKGGNINDIDVIVKYDGEGKEINKIKQGQSDGKDIIILSE